MRPKLRNFIPDVYKDVSYVLDDEEYSAAEYQDVVRKRFVKSWENLTDGYKVLYCWLTSVTSVGTLLHRIFSQKVTTVLFLDLCWMYCYAHGRDLL